MKDNTECGLNKNELLQRKADKQNEMVGTLTGYDCPKCKNRGYISVVSEGELRLRFCSCQKVREAIALIERSGLRGSIESKTFDTYEVSDSWQKNALDLAKRFVENGKDQWFFMGGQSGMGKTHLCTAISGCFLNAGRELRYMLWLDEAAKIKGVVNDSAQYNEHVKPLKTVDVLYIDDLFKTQHGATPSSADVRLAFEILNHRYVNNLKTIISSEHTLNDLLKIDEALGSRIYQMSKDFCFNSSHDPNKNYRLKH